MAGKRNPCSMMPGPVEGDFFKTRVIDDPADGLGETCRERLRIAGVWDYPVSGIYIGDEANNISYAEHPTGSPEDHSRY
jgi:hypothetical protein